MLLKRQIPIIIVFFIGMFTLFGWFVQSYKINIKSIHSQNPHKTYEEILVRIGTTHDYVLELQNDQNFNAKINEKKFNSLDELINYLDKESNVTDSIFFTNFVLKRSIVSKNEYHKLISKINADNFSKQISVDSIKNSIDEKNIIAIFINDDSTQWYDIIASFAIFLGALNLLKLQIQKITKRKRDWQYSGLAVGGFILAMLAGFFIKGKNEVVIKNFNEKNINNISLIISEETNSQKEDIENDLFESLADGQYKINKNYIFESSTKKLINKLNEYDIKYKIYPEWGAHLKSEGTIFKWIFDYIFTPLGATMFALLAFYVASASYRAFRIRNFEATLLLASGIIIMLGRVPIGHKISAWFIAYILVFIITIFINTIFKNKNISFFTFLLGLIIVSFSGYQMGWPIDKPGFLFLPTLQEWIYLYPNVAGARAIMIGIALGMIGTSVRIILGIEKSFMGE